MSKQYDDGECPNFFSGWAHFFQLLNIFQTNAMGIDSMQYVRSGKTMIFLSSIFFIL